MKLKVLNFSTYKVIVEDSPIDQLIGTQCIYPINLQEPLIKTFDSDSGGLVHYCFNIKNVFLFPKYTHSNPNISDDYIFVSDDFYSKYFSNDIDEHILHIYYDIPLIKQIRLKRIDGDFPSDDSIKFLLNDYLEACSVICLGQIFRLDYETNYIQFSVDNIIYKTEFEKVIAKRMEEIEYMIEFNTNLAKSFNLTPPKGMLDSESSVINYQFYYHSLGKEVASLGYVANYGNINEVEIDFVHTELPSDLNQSNHLNHSNQLKPFTFSTKTNTPIETITPTETTTEPKSEPKSEPITEPKTEPIEKTELSKEEIRKLRSAYFEKLMNK
jgi:hypothetical protein